MNPPASNDHDETKLELKPSADVALADPYRSPTRMFAVAVNMRRMAHVRRSLSASGTLRR